MVRSKLLVGCLLLLLAFSGCSSRDDVPKKSASAAQDENPVTGGTIIVASIGDAKRLNPVIANDSASGDINGQVFNGLIKYDKDLHFEGDLAESWDVSDDGLVITFHLRPNVRWQDGVPFTADDVLFTYQKLIDPNVATPYGADYERVAKAEVLDPLTFRVTYKEPFAPALESWSIGIIPKHLLAGKDINTDRFNRHPVGTGPYKFKEWLTGQKIVLTANDDYFKGRPNIDEYIYRIIPDPATIFLELKAKGVDSMGLTPLQYQRQTKTAFFRENFRKFRYPANGYTYLGYNLRDPKFSEKKVRQALAYAINKEDIIKGVRLGLGSVATGPYPPHYWAYNPKARRYPYDPEKARRMLADAGWVDTDGDGILDRDGQPFQFTIITNQGNDERKQAAEIIQQNLRKVGIAVKIKVVEWQAFINQFVDKRNFEAILLGWSIGVDPDNYIMWHSSQTGPSQYNFVSYRNPEVDRLLVLGRKTFDRKKRQEIYRKIHAILAEDQPYCFLYVPDALPIVNVKFHGIRQEKAGIWYNFEDWWVPKRLQRPSAPQLLP
ncbi:MAG: peptide-binding protein [Deltaproteobacteria bacterium]|nr:peptide-binding protein [Deltaproteobacteria bacterium]